MPSNRPHTTQITSAAPSSATTSGIPGPQADSSAATPAPTERLCTPTGHASAEYIDQALPDLLMAFSGYATLSGLLVITALEEELPEDGNWWVTALDVAREWPALGQQMLAHALAMLTLAWKETDDEWDFRDDEVFHRVPKVDPDQRLTPDQVSTLIRYARRPDRSQVHQFHADHMTWLEATAKVTAYRAYRGAHPSDDRVIEVLARQARFEVRQHVPDHLRDGHVQHLPAGFACGYSDDDLGVPDDPRTDLYV